MKRFYCLYLRSPRLEGRVIVDLGGVTASVVKYPYSIEVEWVDVTVVTSALDATLRLTGHAEIAQVWKECGAELVAETERELRARASSDDADDAVRDHEEREDARRFLG